MKQVIDKKLSDSKKITEFSELTENSNTFLQFMSMFKKCHV